MLAAIYTEKIWIVLLSVAAIAVVFLMGYIRFRACSPVCWITPCKTQVFNKLHSNQQMFVDLSHNLQTPLAVLKGRVEEFERSLLHDGGSTGLVQSIDVVSSCINDLLSYTRLEYALKTSEKQFFSLSRLVQELYEDISVIAEDRGIQTFLDCTSDISLSGIEKHVREAVTNLLCNAVKYMGDGPVRKIRITLEQKSGQILLDVTDTGMGIPEHELPRVFERFFRGSNRRYGTIPGTGLGLAVVERVVKEHGGAITVTSDIGKGSSFTLVFPRTKQARFRKSRS